MHRALYRAWRPRTFDDVCGQKHITDILKYQVAEGKTSHAYLFCGSRGTGKTTCAKILAKAVNCLHPVNGNPCNECEACRSIDAGTATDVIEMDAASNNGVDNVRDLKEEIVFMPVALRYRVYIIDEVHMMSASAFNALLKTLEEPPAYVLFILATTELNKLPATIVSRCQRYDFRRIATEVIMGRLAAIARAEGMDLTDDGARMIARAAQGGMRDAISMLELCAGANTTIDEGLAVRVLGIGSRDTAIRVIEAVLSKDYDTLYRAVDDVVASSGSLAVFWGRIGDVVRDLMVFRSVSDPRAYLDLTDSEYQRLSAMAQEVGMARLAYLARVVDEVTPDLQRAGNVRRASVEIALTRMCDPRTYAVPEALAARVEELERTIRLLSVGAMAPGDPAPADSAAVAPRAASPAGYVASAETGAAAAPAGTAAPTPQAAPAQGGEPRASAARLAEPPARQPDGQDEKTVAGWKRIVAEFGQLFPGYASLFVASRGALLPNGTLLLYMRDAFLLGNLQNDAAALRAICRLTADSAGDKVTDARVIPVGAETAAADHEESLF